MDRKILITAIKWSAERAKVLDSSLNSAYKKYGSNMLVAVGYTAPGLKIATIATSKGFSVQMFAPDLGINKESINIVNGITITSSTRREYMEFMVNSVDAVMAFDKGDPVVLTASKLGKQLWFPMGENSY